MHVVRSLLAIFAWIIIQLPVVFCGAACRQSASSALAIGAHACHDADAAYHQGRCAQQRTDERSRANLGEQHPANGVDEDVDHVVVQISTPAPGETLALPALQPARPSVHSPTELLAALAPNDNASLRVDPSPTGTATARSERLPV